MRVVVDGVGWHVEVAGRGPQLVLLHGFTGSTASWGGSPAWAEGFTTVAVDLPGHGASDDPPDAARCGFDRVVPEILAVFDELGVGRAGLLGYSLGARVALHLALAAPGRWAALGFEGVNPGLAAASDRVARAAADERWAVLLETEGVPAFVDRWERQPLFATQRGLPPEVRAALRAQRLVNRAAGLAGSLRGLGLGMQRPLGGRLGAVRAPALLVAGALDTKFRGLAVELAAAWPGAELVVVPGAGHAVHLEQPAAFARAVHAFLQRQCTGEGDHRRWR